MSLHPFEKKIRTIIFITGGIGIFIFFGYAAYKSKKATEKWMQEEYQGVIEEISYGAGNRGFPTIKINNELRVLGMNQESVAKVIQVGDSILKESGAIGVRVYRMDSTHTWILLNKKGR